MRIIYCILFLVAFAPAYSQSVVQIIASVNDEDTGKSLDGATIEVFQDGKPFASKPSASNGKFPNIDLPVNHSYTIYIKKPGYVTKMVTMDTHHDYPEDLPPVIGQKMESSLFKTMDGIDFSFLETTPMIKFQMDKAGFIGFDQKALQEMKVKIEKLKQQMEQQKAENLKKEQEQKKIQADFDAYIKAGDVAMSSTKYDVAITQYEAALKLLPDNATAKSKLEDAKKKLADKQNADAAQKAYAEKLEKAKIAYGEKRLEDALALYKEAVTMMPTDAFPKERVATIEAEIKKQKDEADKFNKLVSEGDVAVGAKLYDEAITKYTAALAIKADPAVQAKLDAAKKKKLDLENANALEKEKDAKYAKLIAEAEAAFNAQNYDVAKAKYIEAVTIKPNETLPTQRLKEIDDLLKKKQAELDAANKLEADYKKLIDEGNSLFTAKNWIVAKEKYTAALALKKNDSYALEQIDLINKELEKQAADAKKDQEYNAVMAEAKSLFDQKKYVEARAKYVQATSIKSSEQAPKDQVIAIDKILADKEKLEKLEADYQNLMNEGNSLKDIKDYTAAIDRYNKALVIKPADPTATQKIAEINKLIADQKKEAELQKQFDDLMAKATTAFNAKDYTTAKMNYQKAFEIKQDPTITAKIKEIDDLIAKNQNEAQTQAKYDAAIKAADELYKANNWEKALEKYEEASAIKSTENYPKERISELKQKIAAQKDAAEKEQQFKDYVAAGDAAFTAKDYQKALASYQEAIKIKPDPTITQKIGQLNTLISQQSQTQQTDEKYKAKIDAADLAFKDKNWETARQLYKDAQGIKPSETYPGKQITEIERLMKEETDAEVEKNYQKIITKADGLKAEERFDEAITYYQNALNIKPSDPYPKQQIEQINKIKQERANALSSQEKLNKEYADLLKQADEAYNAQNYTVALAKYKEALIKKPGEAYPQNQITEINKKLSNQNAQSQVDEQYNKYISQADAAFNGKNYMEAIRLYKEALNVKPGQAYPTNQIEECTRLEKANSVNEVEEQYQKVLEVAQKKFDEGDYTKALELYNRAKSMKPSDPLPQKRIDEINQIIKNKSSTAEYDAAIKQADFHFEKGEWKLAKEFYTKALTYKQDSYPINQIKVIDEKMKGESTEEINKEYQKIITKANEYFDAKNYEKAKNLYERALGIKPSDVYPKTRLDEIDRILNPDKYLVKSNGLTDYGKPINTTDADIEALMLDADEQRKFLLSQKVQQQRVTAENAVSENSGEQENQNFETETYSNTISIDIEEKDWAAEVHRTEANLEVIEMESQLYEQEREWATTNDNDVQFQNQIVNNINTELENRDADNDLPRVEFIGDVEQIKTEVGNFEEQNANYQVDATYDQKENVNTIEEEIIDNNAYRDIERTNVEVYVEDLNITLLNESNSVAWKQEDIVMGVKDNTEVLVDERIANDVGSDIPREEGVLNVQAYELDLENSERNQGNKQYDATIDQKKYTENISEEIEFNNMDNDIPRQKMELHVEKTEIEVEGNLKDLSADQNRLVNDSDDKLDNMEIVLENNNSLADKDRENFEKDVVALDQEIQDFSNNMNEHNENVSYSTVDHADEMVNDKLDFEGTANNKATTNSDNTNAAVEDLIETNKLIGDGNDEEVDAIEDYTDELKNMPVITESEKMKNSLGQEYPEGVTEEIFAQNDEDGLLSKYIVRRIVVVNGVGHVYEKVQTRYGGITYMMDGQGISEYQWTDETEAVSLTRN